jgi:hypothetical protein
MREKALIENRVFVSRKKVRTSFLKVSIPSVNVRKNYDKKCTQLSTFKTN